MGSTTPQAQPGRTLDSLFRLAAIGCALALGVATLVINRSFYHDDAYITLRYAQHLITGSGMVWNPGEYVQGYTNFLHLALIALLGRLGIDLVQATRIVGCAALATLLVVVSRFGRTLSADEHAAYPWHIPLTLVLTSAPLLVWSLGGLEAPLFALLVTSGSFFFLLAHNPSRAHRFYALSGLCYGLGYLTRPDGAVFVAVCLVWLLGRAWRGGTGRLMHLAAYACGLLAIVVPYSVWQFFYYGDVVPNTFYAKAATPLWFRFRHGSRYAIGFLTHPPFLPILAAGAWIHALVRRRRGPHLPFLALSVLAYASYLVLAGGDHMVSFRLFAPAIPLLGVMLALGLVVPGASISRSPERVVTVLVLVAASLQLLSPTLSPGEENPASAIGTVVGKHIAKAWPAGSLVALSTAGSTPYYAMQHRYIDMLGLNDPVIAKRRIEKVILPMQRLPGHLKGDGNYVLSRRPDYVIIGPAEGTVVTKPWFLSDYELNKNPLFHREYVKRTVLLDPDGVAVPDAELVFIYYQRVESEASH